MKPTLKPIPPPIHDCAYGALITFDCAYGAFITLGANATTRRRQSIIYKYPSIRTYLRLFIVGAAEGGERRQTNRRRRLVPAGFAMLGICTHWLRGYSGDGPPHECVSTNPEAVPATALEDDSTSCC